MTVDHRARLEEAVACQKKAARMAKPLSCEWGDPHGGARLTPYQYGVELSICDSRDINHHVRLNEREIAILRDFLLKYWPRKDKKAQ